MSSRAYAVAKRGEDGVRVVPEPGKYIPNLDQWVRDYVDRSKLSDGQRVLGADIEEGEVIALFVRSSCATERAKHFAEHANELHIHDD